MTRSWITAPLLPALALGLASACARRRTSEGDVSARKGAADTAAAAVVAVAPTPTGEAVVLRLATKPGVGTFITDDAGHALYVFAKDQGGKSSCDGDCARAWRPARGRAKVRQGDSSLRSDMTGTTTRTDGTAQATYNDMPLYYFSRDQAANDTNGAGLAAFGSTWYLVGPDGVVIRATAVPPANAPPPPR